jgi:mono/diheme cytochrome c family protein
VKVRAGLLFMVMLTVSCVGRPADDANGQEIYLQLCSNCHGDNLEGGIGPPLGPGSDAAGRTDEFLRVAIHDGRGRMPSFNTSLDDAQLDRLIAYLRLEQSP